MDDGWNSSNNEPNLAYCSCNLQKGRNYWDLIFTLSLTTFKMVTLIEASPLYMAVAYPGFSSPADLFTLVTYEVNEEYIFYNVTGYSSDLKQVWQVELPSDTDFAGGIITVGNSVLVFMGSKDGNLLLEFDSSTGQQIGQWTNHTPYSVRLYYCQSLENFQCLKQ